MVNANQHVGRQLPDLAERALLIANRHRSDRDTPKIERRQVIRL